MNSPFFLISAVALFALTSPTSASLILDQDVDAFGTSVIDFGGPSINQNQFVLQTFTVGVGGLLHTIDLQAQQGVFGTPTSDLVLTLRPTLPNGVPDRSRDFGSVSSLPNSFPAFTNFASGPFTSVDVSGLNVFVTPGDVLAFELSVTGNTNPYFIYDSETRSRIYGGGNLFIFDPNSGSLEPDIFDGDVGFRTIVAIPEPTGLISIVVIAFGFAIAIRRPRRDVPGSGENSGS